MDGGIGGILDRNPKQWEGKVALAYYPADMGQIYQAV